MDDQAQEMTPTADQGPSLSDAVLHMPDDALDLGQERDDIGRWKAKEPKEPEVIEAEATPVEDQPEAAEDSEPEEQKAEPEQPVEDDEGDYIELEAEDGAEPTRIKLEDAVERYQKYEELQAKLEEKQATELPPTDWDQQAVEHVQSMQALRNTIEQWAQLNPVQYPDESMILEDPDAYYAQLQYARNLDAERQHAAQMYQQAQAIEQQKQQELETVQWRREEAKILERHPHLSSKAARFELAKDLEAHYGVSPSDLNEVRNSKAYDIIVDALAYRKSQGQREVVAKAVKPKPKLVRSQARDGRNPAQRQHASAMKRLQTEQSRDAAAEAIGMLLKD